MSRRLTLGARPEGDATRFRVWAPDAGSVVLRLSPRTAAAERSIPLEPDAGGDWLALVPEARPGDRYAYLIDGRGPFPDPASRFQPEGVHGPSEIVDPSVFAWSDAAWRGVGRDDLVIHEIHVGTFTPEGTFDAAGRRLTDLADLGVTAVELMPLNDFPGDRNWGYDGVDLFAPARCYGPPDSLRRFVDAAHRLGLAVLLDVVYNHLGPEGNYLAQFSKWYYSETRQTLWGPALNLDGPHSGPVRRYFVENALHWLIEYRMDGLRLDATHHLFDDGPRHLLAELAAEARAAVADRPVHLIAEDPRNLASILQAEDQGGWGLDAVWSDDFHHELRRYLTGDSEGVFRDFRGMLEDLATTINRGWLFVGAFSEYRGYHRGTDPTGLDPRRFVVCIQNHDRIGNRAFGDRLNTQVEPAVYRAASMLLLLAPQTPLLFMGQEWAASSPFLFFTDHPEPLGRAVREGRRHEFRHYTDFADPDRAARLPDPQAVSTFEACKLDWSEADREPHAGTRRLYRDLLALRRAEPCFQAHRPGTFHAEAIDPDTIVLRRDAGSSGAVVVARLRGSGVVELPMPHPPRSCVPRLSTEDARYALDPHPIHVEPGPRLTFARPGAILLDFPDAAVLPPAAPAASPTP